MNKGTIIKIFIAALILIVIGGLLYFVFSDKEDNQRFKNEYESLNGQKNEHGKTYVEVSVIEDNNVKYASFDEVMDFLNEGTGILYLGFPECPWCRNMVPILTETAKEEEVSTLYYFNALSIRDIKELNDEGKIVVKQQGTKEYYELVDKLSDFLTPYEGLNDEGIKRIYFPTVVFVQGGKIVDVHIGTVDSQEDPYKVLNKKQKAELKKIYQNSIKKIYGICDESC